MSRITRWEWHGSVFLLTLFCLTVVLIPFAVVYFTTNLLKIEEEIADADRLSDYLASHKR